MEARTRVELEAMRRTALEQREYERARVSEHYEHHPEIFRLVLGRQRAYSVGLFADPDDDLEAAQERKLHRIREKLDLRPGENVLDVGCGWGSVLVHLARHTPARVHGITLSSQQRTVALERADEAGI